MNILTYFSILTYKMWNIYTSVISWDLFRESNM